MNSPVSKEKDLTVTPKDPVDAEFIKSLDLIRTMLQFAIEIDFVLCQLGASTSQVKVCSVLTNSELRLRTDFTLSMKHLSFVKTPHPSKSTYDWDDFSPDFNPTAFILVSHKSFRLSHFSDSSLHLLNGIKISLPLSLPLSSLSIFPLNFVFSS